MAEVKTTFCGFTVQHSWLEGPRRIALSQREDFYAHTSRVADLAWAGPDRLVTAGMGSCQPQLLVVDRPSLSYLPMIKHGHLV